MCETAKALPAGHDDAEFIAHAREDVPALVKRVMELTAYLHQIQKHPDFQYAMTYDGNDAHKNMAGWERNPHVAAFYRHTRGQEIYWMRRKEQ